jgi:hypothetical protein
MRANFEKAHFPCFLVHIDEYLNKPFAKCIFILQIKPDSATQFVDINHFINKKSGRHSEYSINPIKALLYFD